MNILGMDMNKSMPNVAELNVIVMCAMVCQMFCMADAKMELLKNTLSQLAAHGVCAIFVCIHT